MSIPAWNPAEALKKVCVRLLERFCQPVLVEEYLPGREFTTAVLGTGRDAAVLGTMEITIRENAPASDYSYEVKEQCEQCVHYFPMPHGALRDRSRTWPCGPIGCWSAVTPDAWTSVWTPGPARVHRDQSAAGTASDAFGSSHDRHPGGHGLRRADRPHCSQCSCTSGVGSVPRRKISVLILYNSPQPSGHGQAFAESEAGVLAEAEAVGSALDRLRIPHRAVGVRWFEELPGVLAAADEPVVFNLVEGFWTDAGQANLVPTVVHSFGKACTGNDTKGLLLSLDKWQSKALLRAAGLPTPQGLIVQPGQRIPAKDLFDGPYIVKPVQTDASEGIDKTSIVRKRGKALHEIVQRIHDQLAQPALIEQYIDGRELNISVIHRDGEPQVLPLAEIDFSAFEAGRPRIVGYEAKWLADSFEYNHTPRIIPAPLPKRLTEQIRELAVAACRTLACLDYCRVDFRLDKANRPYILEVNANPDISPDAGFAAALQAAGISYEAFVKLSIDNALARVPRETSPPTRPRRTRTAKAPGTPAIEIRWCRPEDRQVVLSFLAETGFFQPGEIDIAREVLDAALADGPQGHYQSLSPA